MALQSKTVDKWKLKQWFDVYPPKAIATETIGSIPAIDEKTVTGRVIKVNLSWVTHNPSHSFMLLGLRVISVNGSAAQTDIDYLAQQFSFLHSLVKRHGDAVYTYDRVKDKDGKDVVLKLLITIRTKIAGKTKTDLRKAVTAYVSEQVPKLTKEEFVKSVITSAFQAEGVKRLSKVAPVMKFELKMIQF